MGARLILRGRSAQAYLARESISDALRRLGENARRAAVEKYMDVPPPAGSWEEEQGQILDAARADARFGGPAVEYNSDDPNTHDAARPYHFDVVAAFPREQKATISNAKTGQLYHGTYARGADGKVAFTDVQPAQLEVTTKAQEALRALRESGRADATHRPFQLVQPVRVLEANADGTYDVIAIQEGPGNPVDGNYYAESWVDDVVDWLNTGKRAFYDHPTPAEEAQRPERSVLSLCGWFSDAKKVDYTDPITGRTGKAARAKFHPRVDDPVISSLIRTCQEHAKVYPRNPPFVAFSINGMGVGAPGDAPDGSGRKYLMERMTTMYSTDLVTQAGARGRFIFEESGVRTQRTAGARESGGGLARFAGSDLVVDLRSDEEREADAKAARARVRRTIAESALGGPNGAALRTVLGLDKAKPIAELLKTDDAVDDVLAKIGIAKESSALDTALTTLATTVRETDGDLDGGVVDGDEDEDEDEPGGDGEGDEPEQPAVEAFSDAEIAAMPKNLRKKAKALGKAMKARRVTGSREAARLAAIEDQLEIIGRGKVLDASMARHKVDVVHRPILESLVATKETPREIDAVVQTYARVNLSGTDTAGAPALARERGVVGAGAGGAYKPAFTKGS